MRVLIVAREQMTSERTRTVNALIALVRTVDLGISARTPLSAAQITTIAGWRDREEDATTATCRHEAVRLSRRIRTLDGDLASNRTYITKLIGQDTPQLPKLTGVGAVVAASVLTAWSHPAGQFRGSDGLARRNLPDPGIVRQHDPAPAEPRRRPAPEPRDHPRSRSCG